MEKELKYEWNLSYRIEHWVRVLAIAVLVLTGFYIHSPFMGGGPESYTMAWMNFFHTLSAYALLLGLIVRIYMAFNSSFDRDWQDFGLIRNLKAAPEMLGYYLFLKSSYERARKYDALQAIAYPFIGIVIIFQVMTGAALYKGRLFGFINSSESFRWVSTMLGGESYTRIWHYLAMWVVIIFAGVHIYFSLLRTVTFRDKTFTSMFNGYKLKRKTS
ncbi:MAG: Ni/Fe-hydrogenase, b-type cytochrome subunit [Nitrospirae bacterium]|nr:Ni/Fe-hydrogenase, b-type cytochrome subunit [Nitrospirota bacterium]